MSASEGAKRHSAASRRTAQLSIAQLNAAKPHTDRALPDGVLN